MPTTELGYYEQFLRQLQYDKVYALTRFSDWILIVINIYKNHLWSFTVSPTTDPHFFEFFEFVDGNGFIVTREEKENGKIQLTLKEKWRTPW